MGRRRHSNSNQSTSSSGSANSNESSRTQSTALTSQSTYRPVLRYSESCPPEATKHIEDPLDFLDDHHSRASVDTYASTVPSVEDLSEREKYQPYEAEHEIYPSDALASTPPEFAELFPSRRRLLIHHDDSTSDGNMNLRIDTELVTPDDQRAKMTLFHLKMQDLRDRRFSLRRYCRESGREICSSSRKAVQQQLSRPSRPPIHRSLSSALQSLALKSMARSHRRGDSVYEPDGRKDLQGFTEPNAMPSMPSKIIKLEFANYAQVEVHYERTSTQKRYCFEYWGCQYHWSRDCRSERRDRLAAYQLTNVTSGKVVAYIDPQHLSRKDALQEAYRGGWIPPSEMVISDRSLSSAAKSDVADVIVATGLVALVDDSIRRHWHSKDTFELEIPRKNQAGYTGPERLVDEIFNRPGYTSIKR